MAVSRVRVGAVDGEGAVWVVVMGVLVVGPGGVVAVAELSVTVACTGGRAGRPLMTSFGVVCSDIPRLNARAADMVPTMTAPPRAASGGRGAPVRRVSVTGRRTARHAATSLRVRVALQPDVVIFLPDSVGP